MKISHVIFNDLIVYPYITEDVLEDLPRYRTRPGDVFLVTYPKTGTFWLAEIVYNIAKPKPSSEEMARIYRIPLLEYPQALLDYPQGKLELYPSPRYVKTHLPYEMVPRNSQHNLKYIYLTRNPRDVAVSYFNYMHGGVHYEWDGTWEEFLGYFMQGIVPFGSFFDHVLPWWKRKDDENVLFIKYEDLQKDLKGNVKLIAEFLGFKLTDEEIQSVANNSSFEAMKANPETSLEQYPDSFKPGFSFLRKGLVGDWVNYFSDEQLKEFDKWCISHLQGTGLEFEYTI